jgi:two-component system copper resistance phosphate regulon response regulator CusR
MRALVLEDDDRLRGVVARTAGRAGLAVDEATTIEEADELLDLHQYDLLVLDRRLPDGDGLEVCRAARAKGFGKAILMLTALDDSSAVIDGLSVGADDYIGKPFDLDVLEARMKVLLRRNPHPPTLEERAGDLTLHPWARRLTCAGADVPLTAREFAVIRALFGRPGAVVSREELLEQAWGEREEPMSNTVDVLVARVRRKLADAGSAARIETLRGSGYRLMAG